MKIRDLRCEGAPAFPPRWSERLTGVAMSPDDPSEGILASVEWGRANQAIELELYWQGRRLTGTLRVDEAPVLSRVYELLRTNVAAHLDEIADMQIPPS